MKSLIPLVVFSVLSISIIVQEPLNNSLINNIEFSGEVFQKKSSSFFVVSKTINGFNQNNFPISHQIYHDQDKLGQILDRTSMYCEKVKKVALSFTCTENIESNKYVYRKGATLIINAFGDIPEVHDFDVRDLKLQKIVKDKFIYEYRLVKKDSTLEENRTLLQKNRRKKYKENAELKIQYKGQFVLYGPVGFLSNYWQKYFDYEIVGEELLDKKNTIVVEASPNPANKENRNFAKIWLDEKDFSILQIEWQPQSIADYQRKMQESRRGNLEEKVIWNIKYGVEKNAIKFPSKQLIQRILVDYNWKKKIMEEVSFVYSDYKFFNTNLDNRK